MKNKRYLKKIFCILFTIIILLGLSVTVSAEEDQNSIKDEISISGADSMFEGLSDEIKESLHKNGIDEISSDSLLKLNFWDLIKAIFDIMKDKMLTPIKIFALVAGVMLLNSLFNAFRTTLEEKSSAAKIFSVVAVLSAFAIIAVPITDIVSKCSETIKQSGNFMLSFIPVFVSALTMSGKAMTAGVYSSFLFTAVQLISQIISSFLLPLITVYLALSITGAISDTVNLTSIAETIKKTVTWTLGIMLTIFVGMLSIQSIVANSADTVGVKTAKYIIGSTVPFVGGAISEAFNSLQGCLGLLKSTIGVFGILIIVILYLPVVVETSLITVSLNLVSTVGDILGDKTTVQLTKSTSSAVSILLSIILLTMALNIVSTAAILVIGGGGS